MSSTNRACCEDDDKQQPLQPPIIDLSDLLNQTTDHNPRKCRSLLINQIHQACLTMGCFQIVNHGISEMVMEGAIEVNSAWLEKDIPKDDFLSDDLHKPVRFSAVRGSDGQLLRHFLKLYAYPPDDFVPLWAANPPLYREKMGMYTKAVRKLGIKVIGAIMESLNLDPMYLRDDLERGMQMMAINGYPPWPPLEQYSDNIVKVGATPHADHGIITILLQSCPGLQVAGASGAWVDVPALNGSLVVLVGDHLEVLSNGFYKSPLHRAVSSSKATMEAWRLSIACFHSLAMDEIVEPALELVDEEHPKLYRGCCLRDFINHLSSKEEKPFIERLRIL